MDKLPVEPAIKTFHSADHLARAVAREFCDTVRRDAQNKTHFTVALSGGSTPQNFFRELSRPLYRDRVPWDKILFFWVDERCVPPDHPESNFGMARRELLDRVPVPVGNIIRIRGEDDPDREAARYAREIARRVPGENQLPHFDWILLGMGEDGHTASLFPGSGLLDLADKICAVARHPASGQQRVTMTLPLINQARRISFLISGEGKRPVLAEILNRRPGYDQYPAARVSPLSGKLEFYLDRSAAGLSRR